MKIDTKEKLKATALITFFAVLLMWSFYTHRNETHWFETSYVKIVK